MTEEKVSVGFSYARAAIVDSSCEWSMAYIPPTTSMRMTKARERILLSRLN
jgi:tartrate dehydratase beta subunit/fumarate hydratase class I family protein